jgi:hypothetical protein
MFPIYIKKAAPSGTAFLFCEVFLSF